jgi:gliding motility-associated lipoprotein GldH
MRNLKLTVLIACVLCVLGCQDQVVLSNYKSLSEGWIKGDTLVFDFEAPDTIRPFNLFFNTRLNQDYGFDNLYLISTIHFPNGKQVGDTLEYEMAYPNGELMGNGFGSVKESKLWYKSNVVFSEKGIYKIEVNHAMRKFGKVEALDTLKGVLDFGIQLETLNTSKE